MGERFLLSREFYFHCKFKREFVIGGDQYIKDDLVLFPVGPLGSIIGRAGLVSHRLLL